MAPGATLGDSESLEWDKFYNIIDGKAVETKETRQGVNPATKQPNPPIPLSSKEDLDAAVNAARKAFKSWSLKPWAERKAIINDFGEALAANAEGFAQFLVREQGKPLLFAQSEVGIAANLLKTLTKFELKDEVVSQNEERTIISRHTPLGVAGLIVPWNFPIILLIGKIVPAVLSGNTVVCKSSPFTPYTGLKIVELAQRFFPPGVINAVSGDDSLGPWMTSHPGLDKISFTGSTATGKKVMESCAKSLKRVTLELGGKDPAIIFPDVDIPLVASQIATYSFINSGQLCVATKRIFVHKDIFEPFVKSMAEYTEKNMKVGNGMEPGVFLGPIQNSMQYDRVKGFFDDIKKEGQQVVIGGQVVDSEGYFVKPTIVVNPKQDSRLWIEEPFGPIVPVASWDDEEDVIARANDSDMGLGASIWSNDVEKAVEMGKRMQAGNVWINEHFFMDGSAPFAGHKGSGLGAEYGYAGLASYCNIQSLYIKKRVKALF